MSYKVQYKKDFIPSDSFKEALSIGILVTLVEKYTYINYKSFLYYGEKGIIYKFENSQYVPIYSYNEEYKNFMERKKFVSNNVKIFAYEDTMELSENETNCLYYNLQVLED